MRKLAILLLLASPAFGQLYTGILNTCTSNAQLAPTPAAGAAPACGYRWDLYTGIPGGIPTTLTLGSVVHASGGDDTVAINNAFAACTAGHYISLDAATYHASHLNLAVSNCELRGQGADSTIIIGTSTGDFVTLGSGSDVSYSGVNINSGASAGSQSFVLASAAGVSVGKYLIVTETNSTTNPPGSPSWVTIAGGEGQCNFCDGWSTNGTRARGQIEEVTSVSGTTIGITPPLDTDYTNSPTVVIMTASADHVGLRNLQLFANGTNYGNMVVMQKCAYCYVQGIEDNYTGNPNGNYVEAKWSYRGEIRDSYFSNSYTHTSGNSDDSIFLVYKTTGFIVENNIVERTHVPFFSQWGAANNVFAYNFTQGEFDDGASSRNFVIGGGGHHGAHPQFTLWEGNVMVQYYPDQVWGSSSHNTTFRNWITGTTKACTPVTGRATVVCTPFLPNGQTNPVTTGSWFPFQASRALQIGHWSWYYNFVGDILGSADQMNMLANGNPATHQAIINYPGNRSYDSTNYNASFGYGESSDDGTGSGCSGGTAPCHGTQAAQTAFLYKEYTFANTTTNCTVGGNSGTCSAALPPSLVHSSKPAWWGSLPWPSIGPDVAGGTGPGGHASLTQSNPAQNCYFNIMGGQAGSPNSPLTFNADACYSSAGVPVFSYAPNPVAFGNVAVGANSTVTVTITNSGTLGLIIGTLTTGNAQLTIPAGANHCGGTTVAASGTCNFDLKYAPISASALVCSPATFCVNVPDNAGNPDHINATGTGTVTSTYTVTTPGAGHTTWRTTTTGTVGENSYCTPGVAPNLYDGTWKPPSTDGVAQLPQHCNYTTLAATPTATWNAACPGGALNHNGNAATNGKCWIGSATGGSCAGGLDCIPLGDPRAGQVVDYASVDGSGNSTSISDAMDSTVIGGTNCGIWFNILPTDDNTPTGVERTYAEPGIQIPYGAQCNASNWNWLTTGNFSGLPAEGARINPGWLGLASINGYPAYSGPLVPGRYVPHILNTGAGVPVLSIASQVSYWRFEGLEITNGSGQAYNLSLINRQAGAFGTSVIQKCLGLNSPVTGCPASTPGNFTAVSNVVGTAFQSLTLPAFIVIDHNQFPVQSISGPGDSAIVNGIATPSTSAAMASVTTAGTVGTQIRVIFTGSAPLPYNFIGGSTFNSQGVTGGTGYNTNDTIECGPTDADAVCAPLALTSSQFTYLAPAPSGSGTGGTVYITEEINAIASLNDHIIFNHLLLHGGDSPTWQNNAGVTHNAVGSAGGTGVSFTNSYIGDIWCNVNQPYSQCVEGQGLGGFANQIVSQTIKVYNNFLAASSEGMIIGGSNWDTPTTDVEIRRNHFFKPLIWDKFCLPGIAPAYCGAATPLPVADPTRTLTILTATTSATGVVNLKFSAPNPPGLAANVPISVTGVTGGTNLNLGALIDNATFNAATTGTVITFTIKPGQNAPDPADYAIGHTFTASACAVTGGVNVNGTYTSTGVTGTTVTALSSKAANTYINCVLVAANASTVTYSTAAPFLATGSGTGGTATQLLAVNVKNGLELKNGLRFLIEGNIMGPACTWEGQSDQFGECLHLNLLQGRYNALPGDALSMGTVRYNLFSGANKGIIITEEEAGNVGPAGGNGPTQNPATGPFSIHDNLFDDLNNTKWGLSSAGTPQQGSLAISIGNPFAGPYVPQKIDANHNTFIQSTALGATPISTRAQLVGTTDFSGRTPLCQGTAKPSINADGTGTITFATITAGCTSNTQFTPDPLGYYMEMPIGSNNWAQILSWTSATTYRVNPNLGSNAVAQTFRIQCASGCGTSETAPLTPWPNHTYRNNIAVGGAFNGLFGAPGGQTTVGALNSLFDTTSGNGWCWYDNFGATGAVNGQTQTWVYPQVGTSGPNTACLTTVITTTGCTAKVGGTSPCLNPDTSDFTLSTMGFTAYTDGGYTNLLGGTNDYTLLNTSPGHLAGSDSKDVGADMTKVTSFTTGVQ